MTPSSSMVSPTVFWTGLLICLMAFPGALPRLGAIDVMPEDKAPEELQPGERNPFARRGPTRPTTVVDDRDSEENILRRYLEQAVVSGFVESAGGNSALLGTVRLRANQEVPKIFPNQRERLRVVEITPERLELVFIEPEEREVAVARTVTLRFSLRPQVRFMTGSQVAPLVHQSPLEGKFPPDIEILGDLEEESEVE